MHIRESEAPPIPPETKKILVSGVWWLRYTEAQVIARFSGIAGLVLGFLAGAGTVALAVYLGTRGEG